jgi:hypothetical protein
MPAGENIDPSEASLFPNPQLPRASGWFICGGIRDDTKQPVHGIRGLEASFVNAIGFTCDEP